MKDVVSTASALRQTTLRTVFAALLQHGPQSRADLARLTGLSKQTMSEAARDLEAEGWIRSGGPRTGAIGRRAVTYEVVPACAHVLGVDLGGTKVHVALADLIGTIVGEATDATDPRGGLQVVAQIAAMADAVARQAGLDPSRLRAGSVGCPGVLDPASGRILFAPNIPGLDGFDVPAAFAGRLGLPVTIENDVNLAALGEKRQGRRREIAHFAFVALGTGIGMGIVANGALLRGAHGAAGELAYLPLGGDPFDARGARLGTLETAVGSAAIIERYRARGGDPAHDVRAMFDALGAVDGAAAATLDEVARLLAQALVAVRAVLDPELVVFGGSIGARPELLARVRAVAAAHRLPVPPVEASLLGSRAVLAGALGQALDRLHATLFA